VRELETRLGLRPSGKGPANKAPPARPQRKKPRKKRAHGFSRLRSVPTRQVVHALDNCPHCAAPLTGGTVKWTHEVIEVQPVPAEVIEHVYSTSFRPSTSWPASCPRHSPSTCTHAGRNADRPRDQTGRFSPRLVPGVGPGLQVAGDDAPEAAAGRHRRAVPRDANAIPTRRRGQDHRRGSAAATHALASSTGPRRTRMSPRSVFDACSSI
jgi:hypothetical protein